MPSAPPSISVDRQSAADPPPGRSRRAHDPPAHPESSAPSRALTTSSLWARLIARIYEVFPLLCPSCGGELRIIAFLTEPAPIHDILHHLGFPTRPHQPSPARAPPELTFDFERLHARAREIIAAHRPALDALASAFIERETLEGDEALRILEAHGVRPPLSVVSRPESGCGFRASRCLPTASSDRWYRSRGIGS